MCFGIFTGFFVKVPMEFFCIFKKIININLKQLTLRRQIDGEGGSFWFGGGSIWAGMSKVQRHLAVINVNY